MYAIKKRFEEYKKRKEKSVIYLVIKVPNNELIKGIQMSIYLFKETIVLLFSSTYESFFFTKAMSLMQA